MRSPVNHYKLNTPDIENLGRAREVLDGIYDCIVGMNTQAKPILVQQLRFVHGIIYGLEQKGIARKLQAAVRNGALKPEDLPEWARPAQPFPETPSAAAKEE